MNDLPFRLLGGPYPHETNQIVVSFPHLGMVTDELNRLNLGHHVARTSSLLDLALVELANPLAAAASLRETAAVVGQQPSPEAAIGAVLDALRQLFRAKYAGWAPPMGKNRTVGRLHGVQAVIHSGGGDPTALKAPLTSTPRPAGPGQGVRVGVLDTGLYAQPWLAGGWAAQYSDRLSTAATHEFPAGHATFVTGLILSQAAGATVEVHKVLGENGTAESWEVAEEIVRAGRSGLDVLNLSFACYTENGEPPLVLATAVDRIDSDVVVVAAAGNHGDVSGDDTADAALRPQAVKPAWPAALDDVIAVGAVTKEGQRAPFSPNAPWIDVHAEGVDVRSTYLEKAVGGPNSSPKTFPGGWAEWKGTSFAAALVSGAVAAATEPQRVSAADAARNLLSTLRHDGSAPVGDTQAKWLRLPLW